MKYFISLLIAAALFGCSTPEKQAEKVTVEFRFAETEAAEGLTEIILPITGQKFYLHDEVIMSNEDIAMASVTMWNGKPVVELQFTLTGKDKFAQLTKENLKRRVGMLVDGKLVTAPIINAPIDQGIAIITGDFTKDEAQRIADGINKKDSGGN